MLLATGMELSRSTPCCRKMSSGPSGGPSVVSLALRWQLCPPFESWDVGLTTLCFFYKSCLVFCLIDCKDSFGNYYGHQTDWIKGARYCALFLFCTRDYWFGEMTLPSRWMLGLSYGIYIWSKILMLWFVGEYHFLPLFWSGFCPLLNRDHTTVVLVLTRPLGVTLSMLTTRLACMLESTLVALMEKSCLARFSFSSFSLLLCLWKSNVVINHACASFVTNNYWTVNAVGVSSWS